MPLNSCVGIKNITGIMYKIQRVTIIHDQWHQCVWYFLINWWYLAKTIWWYINFMFIFYSLDSRYIIRSSLQYNLQNWRQFLNISAHCEYCFYCFRTTWVTNHTYNVFKQLSLEIILKCVIQNNGVSYQYFTFWKINLPKWIGNMYPIKWHNQFIRN